MKMKLVALIALAGIITLSLAACNTNDSASSDPLDGTSWVLTAYRKSKPIPGTTISTTFENGQIRGSASCNSYSASYQVSDGTLTVGAIAITEMACLQPEGIMDQEMMLTEFLSEAQTFRITNEQLQIFRSDGEALTFVPQE